jgi:hypothetical protein
MTQNATGSKTQLVPEDIVSTEAQYLVTDSRSLVQFDG